MSVDAWKEQTGGLRGEGRFKSGSWLNYLQSTPKRQWIFFIQKEFEPSSAANAARIGRKRRQEAAVSERRRLKGADRKSARERSVQVRELAISLNVEFFVKRIKAQADLQFVKIFGD